MAFIFSTSHLPETRVRRLDHLEDEEDEDSMQPMPRAGGVRAFSHLPQPARAQADFEGPLSTRPATPVGRPRTYDEPEDDAANNPHNGIDRIMVFDHAGTGRHEFGSSIDPTTKQRAGKYLTPTSPEWKTITSCIKPQGDIVLTGCETAKTDWDETGEEDVIMPNSGPHYLEDMYYAADTSRTPTIHAYDRNVRHRTWLGRLSLTAGRQHSVSTGGYHVEGPEDRSWRIRRIRRSVRRIVRRIKNKAAKKAEP